MLNINQPKVAVVLVNFNGHKDTVECLESLMRQNYVNASIFVVDNSNENDSLSYILNWAEGNIESIETLYPDLVLPYVSKPLTYSFFEEHDNIKVSSLNKLVFIKAASNFGFAAGNNVAVKFILEMDFKYIWFLNNDCVVEKNAIEKFVAYIATQDSNVGLLGSVLYDYYKRNSIQCVGGKLNSFFGTTTHCRFLDDIPNVDYPVGASLFVSVDFIANVGIMNEEYFLYYEELDWVLRGKQLGYEFKILSNRLVYHKEGQSTKGNNCKITSRSEKSDLYSLRSRILFMRLFHRRRMFYLYLGFVVVVFNRIKRGQFSLYWKVINLLLDVPKNGL